MVTKNKTFKKRELIRWRSKKLNLSKNEVLIELLSRSKCRGISLQTKIYFLNRKLS